MGGTRVVDSECEFAPNWENQEGWLVFGEKRRLVCLDWDEFCTKCRKDDTEDYVFALVSKVSEKKECDMFRTELCDYYISKEVECNYKTSHGVKCTYEISSYDSSKQSERDGDE